MINRLIGFALFSIAATAVLAPGLHRATESRSETSGSTLQLRNRADAAHRTADAMVLRRDGSGQFHVTATLDGEEVRFLVDTGADVVALTESTAERIGLRPEPDEFLPLMKTASGTGYGAPVTIDSIEIGGQEFRDVEAVVMRGLGTNLMGQSVLRRMGGVELNGDDMVIRPS